jgi:hypothetical protein
MIDRLFLCPQSAAHFHKTEIDHDTVQPGFYRASLLKLIQVAQRAKEGLLHAILGQTLVFQIASGDCEHPWSIEADKSLGRNLVPGPNEAEKFVTFRVGLTGQGRLQNPELPNSELRERPCRVRAISGNAGSLRYR